MDVMPELLTSVLISKTESTENNKKQKNKQYKNTRSTKRETTDENANDEKQAQFIEKTSNWGEKDRRSTKDRRKQVAQRGRWLESRNTKDRRRSDKGISITI